MTTPNDLTGRAACITGATSGLGRHFAKVLSASGAAVALAGRRIDRLNEEKAEIESAGGKAGAIPLDVTDAKAIAPAFDKAQAELGATVDILINNAGLSRLGLAVELSADDCDTVMATNLRAPFLLATEFARRVIAAKTEAKIVNIASIGAFKVLPGVAPYCTSNAGLAMLPLCLVCVWVNKGINVNALCPGFFVNELTV